MKNRLLSDRSKIILDSKTTFFNEDDWLSNIEKEGVYSNSANIHIEYFETEKFFLLCTSKGGSSFINGFLKRNNLEVKHNQELNKIIRGHNNFFNIKNKYKEEEVDKQIIEYFKLLNGKSKKDLIIVTRNPLVKWMSGVIQDLNSLVDKAPMLMKLVKYEKSDDKLKNQLNLYRSLLPYFLTERFETEGKIALGHSQLYNEYFFQLLLIHSNIDKNKLHIVDIDNPNHDLSDVIEKYYPYTKEEKNISYWTHREKHLHLFKNLNHFLIEQGIEKNVTAAIKNEILNDYKWYILLLETFKDNLWKK
jgi:hypothetical protein